MLRLKSRIIKLNPSKLICLGCALSAALSVVASAQTFDVLASFDSADGSQPQAGLVQGFNGNFYGTALFGGESSGCFFGCGTIFQITPAGDLTTFYSFCAQTGCTDGATPGGALTLATDGSFYGTTTGGGAAKAGTVFRITPSGQLTTLYSFCLPTGCPDGSIPNGGLVLGSDGNYYGTTAEGGTSTNCNGGCGTVFRISAAGQLTTLYTFCEQSGCPDGQSPLAALVEGTDGNFYGTTYSGGLNTNSLCNPNGPGCGTVFRISKAGKFFTIYSFCAQSDCSDGANSRAELTQGSDGNFYGTTYGGGLDNCSGDCGTVFKITTKGTLITLHSFCQNGCTDGYGPYAGLVQGNDGNFYGATAFGGAISVGTLFEITTAGQLTTLYSFCSQLDCSEGYAPVGDLVQGTNGSFYGTTSQGSSNADGAVFALSTGLGPFVGFVNGAGKVGTKVGILGQGLKNTTAVSFNGTAAKFAAQSSTYLVAVVPNGATSGRVTVTSSNGHLISNKKFQVLP